MFTAIITEHDASYNCACIVTRSHAHIHIKPDPEGKKELLFSVLSILAKFEKYHHRKICVPIPFKRNCNNASSDKEKNTFKLKCCQLAQTALIGNTFSSFLHMATSRNPNILILLQCPPSQYALLGVCFAQIGKHFLRRWCKSLNL